MSVKVAVKWTRLDVIQNPIFIEIFSLTCLIDYFTRNTILEFYTTNSKKRLLKKRVKILQGEIVHSVTSV